MGISNTAKLFIFSPDQSNNGILEIIDRSYNLWKDVWLPTLKDLDGIQKLYSDGFTQQDFICAIEIKGTLAGLVCFKQMDLALVAHREDSWFAPWPKKILIEFAELYPLALVPSWLTVSESFRRSNGSQEFNIALVLLELISLNCLDLKKDVAFGTPRKDRSVHKLTFQAGAECIMPNVLHHNVLVDLVAFFPKEIRIQNFSLAVQDLWKNRIDLRIQTTKKENTYEDHL